MNSEILCTIENLCCSKLSKTQSENRVNYKLFDLYCLEKLVICLINCLKWDYSEKDNSYSYIDDCIKYIIIQNIDKTKWIASVEIYDEEGYGPYYYDTNVFNEFEEAKNWVYSKSNEVTEYSKNIKKLRLNHYQLKEIDKLNTRSYVENEVTKLGFTLLTNLMLVILFKDRTKDKEKW